MVFWGDKRCGAGEFLGVDEVEGWPRQCEKIESSSDAW